MATHQTKCSANKFWSDILYKVQEGSSTLPILTTDDLDMLFNTSADVVGTVVSQGASNLTSYGFVWATSDNPTISDNVVEVGTGSFTGQFNDNIPGLPFTTVYFRAYGTNSSGTGYGNTLSGHTQICFAEGTLVTMANGSKKKIEAITFDDELLVWNFDEGTFGSAKPIWMVQPFEGSSYMSLRFGDIELKTVNDGRGHRIYNLDREMFTYSISDTSLGVSTFTEDGDACFTNREIVRGKTKFYNIVTDRHFNMFTNGILTSTGLNNMYPIRSMKFQKDFREKVGREAYPGVLDKLFDGLRLAEQPEIYREKIKFMMERGMSIPAQQT